MELNFVAIDASVKGEEIEAAEHNLVELTQIGRRWREPQVSEEASEAGEQGRAANCIWKLISENGICSASASLE